MKVLHENTIFFLSLQIAKVIELLCKLHHYVTIDILHMLCHSLVYRRLQFELMFLGTASTTNLKKEIRLKVNNYVRTHTFGNGYTKLSPLYNKLKMLNLCLDCKKNTFKHVG